MAFSLDEDWTSEAEQDAVHGKFQSNWMLALRAVYISDVIGRHHLTADGRYA
jgi:hypothetical protein